VFPEYATARKQTALKRRRQNSVGGHGHAIRMVNETAGGRIRCSWHPLLAATQAKLLRSARFSINH
jgi:hypothetical protein